MDHGVARDIKKKTGDTTQAEKELNGLIGAFKNYSQTKA
jgi:hypothetical protein